MSWTPIEADPVTPCRPKRYREDRDYDYIDITCDGKLHDFRFVKDGQHAKTLRGHETCPRYIAYSDAWARQQFHQHNVGDPRDPRQRKRP